MTHLCQKLMSRVEASDHITSTTRPMHDLGDSRPFSIHGPLQYFRSSLELLFLSQIAVLAYFMLHMYVLIPSLVRTIVIIHCVPVFDACLDFHHPHRLLAD